MAKGLDYSDSHPPISAIHAEGAVFVCRYTCDYAPADTSGKNLLPNEKNALLNAGISIVLNYESTADRMLSGSAAGIADAQHANAVANALGMGGTPIYFSADWDVTEGQQAAVNAYLDGAASVIGRARVGIYGGYYPVKRALDAGKATYAWQAFAWSGGQWDTRAQLRQVQNGVNIGGADCDRDISMATDYGQWPRPGTPTTDATISEGATGTGVTKAQQRLNTHGANPHVTEDGAFGPATTTAVKAFQSSHSCTIDGTIGPATWCELNKTPLVAGQLPAPSWLATDKTRLCLTWGPVTSAAGYSIAAYGTDGNTYATANATSSWCVLGGLVPGWTYIIHVWANGGSVAPTAAELTITMPA